VAARRADQRSVIRRFARPDGGLRLRLNPPYALTPEGTKIFGGALVQVNSDGTNSVLECATLKLVNAGTCFKPLAD